MAAEDPALVVAARHALHDEELITAFATDGEVADDAARARSLIERCPACRELYDDVAAIAGVLGAVANAAALAQTHRAPRDFRLSVETANRLRPGSVVLRLRDRVWTAIAAFSRPVGVSMASLGVVGLLLGTLTLGSSSPVGGAAEDVGAAASSTAPRSTRELGSGATAVGGALNATTTSPDETGRTSFATMSTAGPSADT